MSLKRKVAEKLCPAAESEVILAGMVTLLLSVKSTADEANQKAQVAGDFCDIHLALFIIF